MKAITKIFSCLLMMLVGIGVNSAMGATISCAVGGTPVVGALAANGVALLAGGFMPANALHAGVLTEIWTGEMIKAFRTAPESLGWYDRIRSYDQYVENDVIHFTEIGGDPKVLVNNTTYPLNITSLDDADKPVSLDKFDTEATPVTDDELHAVSYDKMASVQERHREALKEKKREKAIHAIAPDKAEAGKTIVLRTTGEKDAATLRKRMVPADLIALKAAFDNMGTPAKDRILVLISVFMSFKFFPILQTLERKAVFFERKKEAKKREFLLVSFSKMLLVSFSRLYISKYYNRNIFIQRDSGGSSKL